MSILRKFFTKSWPQMSFLDKGVNDYQNLKGEIKKARNQRAFCFYGQIN